MASPFSWIKSSARALQGPTTGIWRRSPMVIASVSFLWIVLANFTFFSEVVAIYPLQGINILFVLSLAIFVWSFHALLLALVTWRYLGKPLLSVFLLITSVTAYFIDSYRTVMDAAMINNIFATHQSEVLDLFSLRFLAYVIFLGVLPGFMLWRFRWHYASWQREIGQRIVFIFGLIGVMVAVSVPLGNYYASFIREHPLVRSYTNPSFLAYGFIQYLEDYWQPKVTTIKPMALDATIQPPAKRRIAIMVVGEATRADRWSMNGYARETNPLLQAQKVVNLSNVWSCGTSTAISVPCMFSLEGTKGFASKRERRQENLLDVLQRLGVKVWWLDNNSDSKGVALRVPYLGYQSSPPNTVCDPECRDVGMLHDVPGHIDSAPNSPVLIVLHQMGNHGPSYFKRYPKAFAKWTPECETNQLEQCSAEMVGNAYDNATRYTDYFLSETINLLKRYDENADVMVLYTADHGESLGENGLYLHGLPYALAPDTQRHIASMLWLGQHASPALMAARDQLRLEANQPLNHDIVVNTLLGFFGVKTHVYQPAADLLRQP